MQIERVNKILDGLHNADLSVLNEDNNYEWLASTAKYLLDIVEFDQNQLTLCGTIVEICNILYNNTDIDLLPVEDGIYDLLLEKYKRYNPNYLVGAKPIIFKETEQIKSTNKLIDPITFLDMDKINNMLFVEEIIKTVPKLTKEDLLINPITFYPDRINKRIRTTKHEYPELVGTLDKCKYVLCSQAEEKGVLNDSNVSILERDFFQKHIKDRVIEPDEIFGMVLELKYDGISIEAEVSDHIISARTRGDTNESLAADITPILYGYTFNHCPRMANSNSFGMKFEAVMTYDNLYRYNLLRGKDYKNCRTAISSIFSSSDAYLYRDFITLIPLATSNGLDRLIDIMFMNEFYHSGEFLRYAYVEGDYKKILFLIKKFVEEAEYSRSILPFMYDGIVVSYIDEHKKEMLGRKNSVNKWSMAVKFNALKKQTIFRRYEYTVGQNGTIVPMIYYDPVEFLGTVHDHSTGSSYGRFLDLGLRLGDIIDVEYVNDVMPYVTKPFNSANDTNPNPIITFINECPSCETKLEFSTSGKSMICPNMECKERNLSRMSNLLDKLNLRDFSESTIESLIEINKFNSLNLSDLMNLKLEDVEFLGEINSLKFMDRINELKTNPIYDFKIIGSLGFTGIAVEKWKTILNVLSLNELMSMNIDELRSVLSSIKGIGPITANTICNEMGFFYNDLSYILQMKNVIISKGVKFGKQIRFTGCRDKELMEQLNIMGHNASESSVTSTTDILLVPESGHISSKTKKVGPNTLIIPITEFRENIEMYLM